MNRVKRWLLILAAVVIVLPNVQAVKATALIFGRTPASATSSTGTTSTTQSTSSDENEDVPSTDEEEITKPPLTGIPQIDYIWDPNLPRELNGFNLSTYPFLSSVPDAEDIDFKCDGLHDGFYASIKFGCQLYHHCIYGIRHDFLCANFTAFDQKTFICHFVSEVNCKNSAKYWFRNDALYRATTTTTTTTTTVAPPPTTERQRRPMARKPLRRRRPQNDYYYEDEEYEDDYVEERSNRRRKPPPRNRYRPVYEDDYPNERGYEEDEVPVEDDYDYEQRSTNQSRNRNRPASNRRYRNRERNNRRNLNEPRSSTRSQQDEPRSLIDSRQPEPTRRLNRDRRPMQEDRERVRERDRDRNRYATNNSNKRPLRNEEDEPHVEYERPRQNYDEADDELPRRNNFRNTQSDKRIKGRTTPSSNRDDFDDATPPSRRKNVREEMREEELPKVRPSSNGASVFTRPRVPPKISRPVPINEKQKYDYKKNENPSAPLSNSDGKEDYYDEYEDEQIPAQKPQSKPDVKPQEKLHSKATRNSEPSSKEDVSGDELVDEEYDDDSVSEKYDDRIRNHDVKIITKTEKESKISTTGEEFLPQTVPRMNKNSNDNNEHSSTPSGPSIFQTEQQQKIRDKFRNSFRSNMQSRQPVEDVPKEQPEVITDDRNRNNQKPSIEQQNIRGKFRNNYRSNVKELRPPLVQTPSAADDEIENVSNVSPKSSIYFPYRPSTSKLPPTAKDNSPQINVEPPLTDELPRREQNQRNQPSATDLLDEDIDIRPAVRVVKRPFLPSRGGNPYLPRGLRPVGSSEEETYNSPSNKDQNARQPEPITLQHRGNINYDQRQSYIGPLTTQPPMEPPKDPLEHIYSEYDVTLNDALNPTLKPLVTSRGSPIGFSLNNKYEQQEYAYVPLNTAPTQPRSSSVQVPYADKKLKTHYVDYEY